MPFELTLDADAVAAVIHLRGELDIDTIAMLKATLDDLFASGRLRVEVDCGGLTFLDSTGIGTLVGGYNTAQQRGGTLWVANANAMPLRALQLTGLEAMLCTPPTSGVDVRTPDAGSLNPESHRPDDSSSSPSKN